MDCKPSAIRPRREALRRGRARLAGGLAFSLFGLTATTTTFDGRRVEQLRFPEHSLDLDRLDGALVEPGGPRHADAVCASLAYRGSRPLGLRLELADAVGGRRFSRIS